MKYYLPTFDDIDHLREDFIEDYALMRRANSMFKRADDDSMGAFYAQNSYDSTWDDDEMRYW